MDPFSFILGGVGTSLSSSVVKYVVELIIAYLSWLAFTVAIGFFIAVRKGFRPRGKTFDNDPPNSLLSRIYDSCVPTDDQPGGPFIGWVFLGIIRRSKEGGSTVYIVSTESTFKDLTSGKNEDDYEDDFKDGKKSLKVKADRFKVVHITGNYSWRHIIETRTDPIDAIPKKNQKGIIDSIVRIKKKSQVVMITGNPGTGKSFIADLLISDCLKHPRGCFEGCDEVRYCYGFNPLEPNTFFSNVYNRVKPSKKRRLIVLYDEVDVSLDKIKRNDLIPNPKFPREVFDKTSWNRFLDNFDRGYYPWVTLIMTSNRSQDQINPQLDSSFLREGRVDYWFSL